MTKNKKEKNNKMELGRVLGKVLAGILALMMVASFGATLVYSLMR